MAFWKVIVRIVRCAAIAVVSIAAMTFLTVQVQQRTLRWRAERLSADIQQITLYKSTWADAQRLMDRWGAWGHYDGSCTAASCKYNIELSSLGFNNPLAARHRWVDWLLVHDRLNLYQWFGGRAAGFAASFTVRDGTIWRKGAWMGIVVSNRSIRKENEWDRSISVGAESAQRLHETIDNLEPFIAGTDEQLAQHPYYKVGRPGGCLPDCQMARVYYSTRTPPAEIERLTAFDFSCITQWNSCARIEDLLPAAKEWHVYDDAYETPERKKSTLPARSCDIPVWALARDARYVLSVEVLSAERVKEHELDLEMSKARVVGSIKQPAPWLSGSIVSAYPFVGNDYHSPPQEAEHLIPGKRYIVFPMGDDRRDRRVTKDSPLWLDRCGVQEDTPEIRQELEVGFAQNDALLP